LAEIIKIIIIYLIIILVFQAVAAALMMNIYIVGLNQLTDIEIDKVAFLSKSL
jgi:4-hydroxybenzoate polyprenyltransferase